MNESYIDGCGGMLQPGNREAVRQTCGIAVDRLLQIAGKAGVGHDDVLEGIISALQRIAAGESPDKAFGWARERRGRQSGNHALRDWEIRMTVRDRMRAGESREGACGAVSSESGGEFLLGFEAIKLICKNVTVDADLPMPENIYPIDPVRFRR